MKKILAALFILISSHSNASDLLTDADSSFHHALGFSSRYFSASNAITNNFALDYYRGEFIDDSRKNSVSKNLSSLNRWGAGYKAEINFAWINKTIFNLPNSFFSVSLNDNAHINSEFKKDVFELYFRGNKQYAGKVADLGDFTYNQIYFQQLNVTFGHKYKFNENNFGYSAGLSLNKGQKLYKISASRASIYTEKNGEYIDLDANVEIHQSDSLNSDIINWNGTGFSGDFSFFWKDKRNDMLKISATNFGFINWNNQTAHVKADTSFRFEGVDVSDLFLLNDSVKKTVSLDSSLVEPYLSVREKKNYIAPLPALLQLSYQYYLNPEKISVEAELSYLFFAGSKLRESLAFNYNFNSKNRLSLITSNGGYTGFQIGLSFKSMFSKNLYFTIQSDYLSSMLNPNVGCAQEAFISLTTYF